MPHHYGEHVTFYSGSPIIILQRFSDHKLQSSARVKNAWSCTSIPTYAFIAWCSGITLLLIYFYLYFSASSLPDISRFHRSPVNTFNHAYLRYVLMRCFQGLRGLGPYVLDHLNTRIVSSNTTGSMDVFPRSSALYCPV